MDPTQLSGLQAILQALAQGGQPQGNLGTDIMPLLQGLIGQRLYGQTASPSAMQNLSPAGRMGGGQGFQPMQGPAAGLGQATPMGMRF